MDLKAYVRLLRFHWVAILVLTLLGAAGGAAVAQLQPPVYAAKAQMLVTVSAPVEDSSQAYQGALLSQQRAKSYTTLLTSQAVLGRLTDQLGLPYSIEHMQSHITATNPKDTAVIDVTVKDRSAGQAKQIAEALGPAFSRIVSSAENPAPGGNDRTPVINFGTLDGAELLDDPVSPRRNFDIALGLAAGFVLGLAWAVVREVTDTRIRDLQDLAQGTDVDVLGVLPRGGRRSDKEFRSGLPGPPAEVQAYRWLALTTEIAGRGPRPRAYVVASAVDGDRTTAVAAGLAIALAESGTRTIVVDAQRSRAQLAVLLGVSSQWGLVDVLNDRASVDDVLRRWRDDVPLHVLAGSGTEPDSGAAPLRQADVAELCNGLMRRADVVIFAAPSVLTQSDTTIVARTVGQVILVAEAMATRMPDFAQSVQRLRSVGVTVLGAVLSGERGRRSRPYASAVEAPAPVDGHDVRPETRGRPHAVTWPRGASAVSRLEPKGGRR
ncbi:polysaccharide biosynthesis tyrosine autokinase [Streptomyces sp. YU58]|uniref:polysaccharide biosynthesis tyrosine autokinase n=1 Tax=Streptomyces sp. SX92 TaxID=3158972 RepID=UPI0027BAAC13|nr:polysaccharide biosynthesis tyrosine autokinase [Streptomyces coralus]WLW50651.1 Wzz/FepE/Etk N-terminal domain-containing protein [Streptomyces coralus]